MVRILAISRSTQAMPLWSARVNHAAFAVFLTLEITGDLLVDRLLRPCRRRTGAPVKTRRLGRDHHRIRRVVRLGCRSSEQPVTNYRPARRPPVLRFPVASSPGEPDVLTVERPMSTQTETGPAIDALPSRSAATSRRMTSLLSLTPTRASTSATSEKLL